jgi:hypothetical protein
MRCCRFLRVSEGPFAVAVGQGAAGLVVPVEIMAAIGTAVGHKAVNSEQYI